ncbi:hypothetical protein ACSMXN_04055 [Jatrophihabitans sp. DSM 45814]
MHGDLSRASPSHQRWKQGAAHRRCTALLLLVAVLLVGPGATGLAFAGTASTDTGLADTTAVNTVNVPDTAILTSVTFLEGVPTRCAVTTDVSNPAAGLTVTGAGFRPKERFTIYLQPQVVAKPVTTAAGAFSVRIPLPAGITGPAVLQVEGAGCAVEVTFQSGQPDSITNPPPLETVAPVMPHRMAALPVSTGLSVAIIAVVAAAGVGVFLLASRAGHRGTPR